MNPSTHTVGSAELGETDAETDGVIGGAAVGALHVTIATGPPGNGPAISSIRLLRTPCDTVLKQEVPFVETRIYTRCRGCIPIRMPTRCSIALLPDWWIMSIPFLCWVGDQHNNFHHQEDSLLPEISATELHSNGLHYLPGLALDRVHTHPIIFRVYVRIS